MKTLITISFIIAGIITSTAHAQVVSDRTNEIKIDFTKESGELKASRLKWEYPSRQYTNSTEKRINFKCTIESPAPITAINLIIRTTKDGDPIGSMPQPFEEGSLTAIVDRNINLRDGQNYVEIEVTNSTGAITSDYRSIVVGLDAIAEAIAIDRKDYGLIFATDVYDQWNDLVNPVFDAEAISQELTERYGFEVRIVKNATQEEVFTILKEYGKMNFRPQDQLFIMFAGHGQYDETFGEGYVVAKDSRKNDPGKISYISHNRLRNIIDNIQCEHIFLTMDVCFGGTLNPVVAHRGEMYDEMENTEFIIKKLSTKTRKYLTSGGKEYVPDGVQGQHSPFTKKFLEALKSNGGDDRILITSELGAFMSKLPITPHMGSFGNDETGSEFLFISY